MDDSAENVEEPHFDWRRWRDESGLGLAGNAMPLQWICERLVMRSWKGVNRRLYEREDTKC